MGEKERESEILQITSETKSVCVYTIFQFCENFHTTKVWKDCETKKKKQRTNRELFISAAFVSVWLVFNGNWYDLQTNYVGFSQKRNSSCVWLPIREYRKLQEVINLCLSYKFGIVYGERGDEGGNGRTDRQAGRQVGGGGVILIVK